MPKLQTKLTKLKKKINNNKTLWTQTLFNVEYVLNILASTFQFSEFKISKAYICKQFHSFKPHTFQYISIHFLYKLKKLQKYVWQTYTITMCVSHQFGVIYFCKWRIKGHLFDFIKHNRTFSCVHFDRFRPSTVYNQKVQNLITLQNLISPVYLPNC